MHAACTITLAPNITTARINQLTTLQQIPRCRAVHSHALKCSHAAAAPPLQSRPLPRTSPNFKFSTRSFFIFCTKKQMMPKCTSIADALLQAPKQWALDLVAVAVDADDQFVFKFDSMDALHHTNATKYTSAQ